MAKSLVDDDASVEATNSNQAPSSEKITNFQAQITTQTLSSNSAADAVEELSKDSNGKDISNNNFLDKECESVLGQGSDIGQSSDYLKNTKGKVAI